MLSKRLATAVLACGVLGIVSSGYAQGPPPAGRGLFPQSQQAKSLADQFDDFTRKLFGLPLGNREDAKGSGSQARSGSSLERNEEAASGASQTDATAELADRGSAPGSRLEQLTPKSSVSTWPGPAAAEPRAGGRVEAVEQEVEGDASSAVSSRTPTPARKTATVLSGGDDPTLRPLHERLEGFQRSVFERSGSVEAVETPASAGDSAGGAGLAGPPPQEPTPAGQTDPREVAEELVPPGAIAESEAPQAGRPPAIAEQPLPTDAEEPAAVLFSREGPSLSVKTAGPRQIAVGKEATYEVTIRNRADIGAEDVIVYVALPSWADVVGSEATTGRMEVVGMDQDVQPLQWQIEHLLPRAEEKLLLKILPRESRPFDLAVRWEYQPVASQAMIEVQEPKLLINLDGPREVLYGEKELYTLDLSNMGTGDAENVLITLVPIGAGENQAVSQNLGTIKVGERKTIEVELTARQTGDLTIKVEVRGDGGLYAELAEGVTVRRAALQVDVEGPNLGYVDALASYRVSVRNPGTAAARNLGFSLNLPPKAEYVRGIEGALVEANGTKVEWQLGTLAPAETQTYVIQCRLETAGLAQIDVVSRADGDLTASAGMTTKVEAMADLVLQVRDPVGAVPVGEQATYELEVRNRGTKSAEDVRVVAYFSEGIEPTLAEGAMHKIEPGQVLFSPFAVLGPGEFVLLKVHARAEAAGTHTFRAEVHCLPLETRLVCEDTTRFYQEDSAPWQLSDRAEPREAPMGVPAAAPLQAEAGLMPITAERPTPAAVR